MNAVDLNKRFDSVVEVLDLEAGRVVVRQRFRDHFFGSLRGRPVVYAQREGEWGAIVMEASRLRLVE